MRIKVRALLLFVLCFGLIWVMSSSGLVKYIVGSVAMLFLFALHRRVSIQTNDLLLFLPFAVYIIFGIVTAIVSKNISSYSIRIAAFEIIPYMMALLAVNAQMDTNNKEITYILFAAILVFYAVVMRLGDESQYAFILGAYVIFFLWDDSVKVSIRLLLIIVCIGILYSFAGKRLATISALLCLCFYGIMKGYIKRTNLKRLTRFTATIWIIFSVLLIIYLVQCENGLGDTLLRKYHIVVSGREDAWRIFSAYYKVSPLYVGKGIGWVDNTLNAMSMRFFHNLHNDVMMAYIELGFMFFLLYLISFLIVLIRIKKPENQLCCLMLFIYTFINYMTDNIMIYINYWFPLYMILFCIWRNDRTASMRKVKKK